MAVVVGGPAAAAAPQISSQPMSSRLGKGNKRRYPTIQTSGLSFKMLCAVVAVSQ
jgi:hypothetical protein